MNITDIRRTTYCLEINETIITVSSVFTIKLKANSHSAISFKVGVRFRNHQVSQLKLKMYLLELRNKSDL